MLATAVAAAGLVLEFAKLDHPFQLAVEVTNKTDGDIDLVTSQTGYSFPFFPGPSNFPGKYYQFGQSPFSTTGSTVGAHHPVDTITDLPDPNIDVWDCNAVGLDGNIGSVMYQTGNGLRILVAWLMSNSVSKNLAALMVGRDLSTDPVSYWKQGGPLATQKSSEAAFGRVWQDHEHPCRYSDPDGTQVTVKIGGNKTNISLTIEISASS